MFPKSSTDKKEKIKLQNFDPQNLPGEEKGYEILAVDYYSFPIKEIELEYTVLEQKKLNVIEKYILKAAAEIKPAPIIKETASILSLNQEIIFDFAQNLAEEGLLAENIATALSITEEGAEILAKTVEKIEKSKKLKLNYDIFTDRYQAQLPFAGERDDNFIPDKFPYINWEKADRFNKEDITPELIQKISLENNEFQQLKELKLKTETLHPAVVILIYDILKSELMFKVLSAEDGNILTEHQRLLNSQLTPNYFAETDILDEHEIEDVFAEDFSYRFLSDLGLEFIAEDEAELTGKNENYFNDQLAAEIKEATQKKWKAERNNEKASPVKDSNSNLNNIVTAEYLSKEKIRPKYVEMIEKAEEQILILSGWINRHTVDDAFIKRLNSAAKRGVLMLLGWGMKDYLKAEDREKNNNMRKLLSKVKTPAGIPAVSLYWVGEQHQKEVIVDQKYHLLGSHNFLSYRGDHKRGYKLRHESAYFNRDSEGVKAAFENQSEIFIDAMRKEFSNYIMNFNGTLPKIEPLSSWLILNREKELLRLMKIEAKKSERNQEAVIIYLEKFSNLLLEQEKLNDRDYSALKAEINELIEDNLQQGNKLKKLLANNKNEGKNNVK